jgi:hypothetical protein
MNNFGFRIGDFGFRIEKLVIPNPQSKIRNPKSEINNLFHPVVFQVLFENNLDIPVI